MLQTFTKGMQGQTWLGGDFSLETVQAAKVWS